MGPYRCDKKHNDSALLNNEMEKDQSFKSFLETYGDKVCFYMDRGYSYGFNVF